MVYLSCPVCLEDITDTKRPGVVLPECRHTLCEQCLSQLPSPICPLCRRPHLADTEKVVATPDTYTTIPMEQNKQENVIKYERQVSFAIGHEYSSHLNSNLSKKPPDIIDNYTFKYKKLFTKLVKIANLNCISVNSIWCKCLILALGVFLLSLFVTMTIMGFLYIKDCPAQPFIPIWLVVDGLLGILLVFQILETLIQYMASQTSALRYMLLYIHLIFHIVWLIMGCIWVHGVHPGVQELLTPQPVECNSTVYTLAYWLLNIPITILIITVGLLAGFLLM